MTAAVLTTRGFLEELIPALMAAGLTKDQIRSVSNDARRRMGEGGTTKEWVLALAAAVAELDDPIALRAFHLAFDAWEAPTH